MSLNSRFLCGRFGLETADFFLPGHMTYLEGQQAEHRESYKCHFPRIGLVAVILPRETETFESVTSLL